MRKIKRPNISVKPREVFYRLKRSRQLGDLSESSIEEILNKWETKNLLDMGCVYESFTSDEIKSVSPKALTLGASATIAIATLGDKGFEAQIKQRHGESDEAKKVVLAWAGALLDKLVDFTNGLIREEITSENLEPGPSSILALEKDQALTDFIWKKLSPEEKISVRLTADPINGAPKLLPEYSRVWLAPWLTKKEKKQLAAA